MHFSDGTLFVARACIVCSSSHLSGLVFTEQLYTFRRGVGDGFLRLGVVASPDTFAQLTLEPSFRFFARDEDNLYVSYVSYGNVLLHSLIGNCRAQLATS